MRYKITTPATVDPISLTEAKLHLRVDHTSDDELIRNLIRAATVWCECYERRAYCVQTVTAKMDEWKDEMFLPLSPLLQVDSIGYIDGDGDTQTLSTSIYTVDTNSEPGRITLTYDQNWPVIRAVTDCITITYKVGYCTKFTTAFGTDIFTVNEAIFSDTDAVRLTTDQGDLPASLAEATTYYVRDVTGSTLKLAATSGGTAINLTDDGTGTHLIGKPDVVPARVRAAIKLILGHLYEHREEATEVALDHLPFAARNLLMERVWICE